MRSASLPPEDFPTARGCPEIGFRARSGQVSAGQPDQRSDCAPRRPHSHFPLRSPFIPLLETRTHSGPPGRSPARRHRAPAKHRPKNRWCTTGHKAPHSGTRSQDPGAPGVVCKRRALCKPLEKRRRPLAPVAPCEKCPETNKRRPRRGRTPDPFPFRTARKQATGGGLGAARGIAPENESVSIPATPGKTAMEQMNHYFHLAKRAKKRAHESAERIHSLEQNRMRLMAIRARIESAENESDLVSVEQETGINRARSSPAPKAENRKIADFSGRKYLSKEGLTILAGRNLTENLELTFKIARGNDLWLHVKGRPGSHTVILLPPGRSASLDTLLDAAHLCILHSGGKDWGKTEVDYTFRKHVKRIKNQTEVSYSQNKTLAVTLEEARVAKLSAG
ncbi:MAG: DUF814 domain-containing protein [Proteobacteria bacterium]|nr:DUF814 domain-containing protein [Pseudomonadota bacterium]